MATTNSRRVAKCATIVRTVATAGEKCADEIGPPLTSLLYPDGLPPDLTVRDFILALVALLVKMQTDLEEKDMILAKELGDDVAARDGRDEQYAQLRSTVISTRTLIESLFGSEGLARAGLRGPTPTNHDLLIQLANSAAHQIESKPLGSAEGVALDSAAVANKLRTGARGLRAALDFHKTEERETQLARAARDLQLDLWFQIYPGIANVIAGLATIVGRSDIAERVRPTARRRVGEPEPVDLDPELDPPVGELNG